MTDPGTDFTSKAQEQIAGLRQEAKEKDIQERAKRAGYPYVNLLHFTVNPDLRNFVPEEKSLKAKAAVFFRSGKKVRLAVLNPDLPATRALVTELKIKGYDVSVIMCSSESLENAQKVYAAQEREKHGQLAETVLKEAEVTAAEGIQRLEELKDKIEHSPFDEALTHIQVGAYSARASDIHFQPENGEVLVRFRIDGVLRPVFYLSKGIYEGLLKQIKFLSHLKLNIFNIPQDGQYAFIVNQRKINVRVSLMPSHYGETAVMRLLDTTRTFEAFESLGFEGEALKNVKEALGLPHGMILVTGPTGSGKTTTMYSMLQSVDTKAKKVITLEDPIEYDLTGITQSQVNPDVNYNFPMGLRAILRQDPDIIMVGEIRDLETAETAAQASLTGHLVITTLHTNSALESIARMSNMGVKSFILAPALDLIIAQRLVRRICECGEEKALTEAEKKQIEEARRSLITKGVEVPPIPVSLKHPKGCEQCGMLGYRGQIAITEVLRFSPGLRDLILEARPMSEVYAYVSEHHKMVTLREDGILKVLRGITTLEEIFRVAA